MNEEKAKARVERARLRMQRQPAPVQYLVVLLGLVLVLGGLVMLVTPGPAFLVIQLGLGLLSVKSDKAKRAADRLLDGMGKASRLPRATKLAIATVVLFAIAAALWAYLALR
jgi:hypothetical protein